MKPEEMIGLPVEKRRGAVTQETGSWRYLLVDQNADAVLNQLLEHKVIGAARRDCLADVTAGKVLRPIGPWGVLVRLKGHRWTYLLGDQMRLDWAREWASAYGWRVAWFSLNGMINTKLAQLYDGPREVFNFIAGLFKEPEDGFIHFKTLDKQGLDSAMIRGESDVCTPSWLKQHSSGGEAMDLLARIADAYLPVALGKGDKKGKAAIGGWDGEPYPDDDGEREAIPVSAFERVDVFTFGGADTLEPSAASIAFSAAVRAADAEAVQRAVAEGADPNLMCDDDDTPLEVALQFGSPFLGGLAGGRFEKVSREQQLALLSALLKAGAKPNPERGEPTIHQALHWADKGDEQTILNQLKVLLLHHADPNAMGGFLASAGQRPLHVVVSSNQWLGVVKLLVQNGADLTLTNHKGHTPLQAAQDLLSRLDESLGQSPNTSAPETSKESSGSLLVDAFNGRFKDPKDILKQMGGALQGAAAKSNEQKRIRLLPIIEFLKSAEEGKADFSDIEAIASASTTEHVEQRRQEKERADAKVSVIRNAMKEKLAALKKEMKDLEG